MNIGLIGCGRVGTTLFYLLRKRHSIVGVYDTIPARTRRAMRYLHMRQNTGLETLVKKSTALFLATPDDAIAEAYQSIKKHITGRKYVFHFSGALLSAVIPEQKGLYRAAVHPFATFPRLIIPPKRRRIVMYIEGDAQARGAAKRIFQGRVFSTRIISQSKKIHCHLSGVFWI